MPDCRGSLAECLLLSGSMFQYQHYFQRLICDDLTYMEIFVCLQQVQVRCKLYSLVALKTKVKLIQVAASILSVYIFIGCLFTDLATMSRYHTVCSEMPYTEPWILTNFSSCWIRHTDMCTTCVILQNFCVLKPQYVIHENTTGSSWKSAERSTVQN